MLQGSSPQLKASGGGGGGEGLSFLLGAGHWKLNYVPVSEYIYNTNWIFFLRGWGEDSKFGGGVDLGEWGSECDQGVLYETIK